MQLNTIYKETEQYIIIKYLPLIKMNPLDLLKENKSKLTPVQLMTQLATQLKGYK